MELDVIRSVSIAKGFAQQLEEGEIIRGNKGGVLRPSDYLPISRSNESTLSTFNLFSSKAKRHLKTVERSIDPPSRGFSFY